MRKIQVTRGIFHGVPLESIAQLVCIVHLLYCIIVNLNGTAIGLSQFGPPLIYKFVLNILGQIAFITT